MLDLDEATVVAALERLHRRGFTRLTSHAGSRARKYRHLLDRALGLGEDELAVLGVLMLRGPQTPGELKGRSERLHGFPDLDGVQATLERLAGRELVAAVQRRPGQKEQRYRQLLGGSDGQPATPLPPGPPADAEPPAAPDGLEGRVARLEDAVSLLREELAALRGRGS